MFKFAVLFLISCLFVGCSIQSAPALTSDDTISATPMPRPGWESGRVYTQEKYTLIDGLADCSQLQSWFNATMDAHDGLQLGHPIRGEALDYSKYIDARMKVLGCYK